MLKDLFDIEVPEILEQNLVLFKDEKYGLTYGFKEPVEHPSMNGYFYVATRLWLVVNKEGSVFNLRTNKVSKFSKSKPNPEKNIVGGYLIGRDGSRHRLMCLAFKPYDRHPQRLWVNHLNGIPGDDRLDNLEWATPSQNVQHAYDNNLHRNKVVSVIALNYQTGEEIEFTNIAQASRYTGVGVNAIGGRIRRSNGNRYPDGWRFKTDGEWVTLDTRCHIAANEKQVTVLNLADFSYTNFDNATIAATHFKLSPGTVIKHCREESTSPIYGRIFRYVDGRFPEFGEHQLKLLEKTGYPQRPLRGVIGISSDGTIEYLDTLENATKDFGYTESGIATNIRLKKPINGLLLQVIACKGK